MLSESADSLISAFLNALQSGEQDRARAYARSGMEQYPGDGRFYLCQATLLQAEGDDRQAFTLLWRALVTDPGNRLARDEIRHAVLMGQASAPASTKDFSLHSGERQIAERVEEIRLDHRLRYQMAARWIKQKFAARTRHKTGLDLFSGNGYGSRIIAEQSGSRMFGIDGSTEAVELAERAYGSHRVVFGQAIHPFEIGYTGFDFVVSLESIEHVESPEKLLRQMAHASDGPFIISFPDEEGLPFSTFGDKFEHHVTHYRRDEMVALLARVGRTRIVAEYGQNVYRVEQGEMTGLLPEREMGLFHPDTPPQFRIMIVEPE